MPVAPSSIVGVGPNEPFELLPTAFDRLDGFGGDDLRAAWRTLARSAAAIANRHPALRRASELAEWSALAETLSRIGEPATQEDARGLFADHFAPYRIVPDSGATQGFLTGYYEPVVEASRVRTAEFSAPVLARPSGYARLDHVHDCGSNRSTIMNVIESNEREHDAARKPVPTFRHHAIGPGVATDPYPDRTVIEAAAERGALPALAWLRDWAEVFLVQVQGSARIVLPDGAILRLIYDGRNGQPYTSIGRILIDEGLVSAEAMSLARLKNWIRTHGQALGEPGRTLMARNRSYVFFRTEAAPAGEGPIGGQGVPLEALRSIAVDRAIWPYGLPFWIEADIPWHDAAPSPFRRLMVAQDTGSAILGAARADLFFGSGDAAGALAGGIRHAARFTVLLPRNARLRRGARLPRGGRP